MRKKYHDGKKSALNRILKEKYNKNKKTKKQYLKSPTEPYRY